MGYELERFLGYVNDGLLCCVCRDVLRRPLQAPCEHVYCVSCITFWLNQHKTCPQDRLPLEESQLKPLFRYMRNDLDRLQIRCINSKKGCGWIGSLEVLPAHEDQCHFEDFPETDSGAAQALESELWKLWKRQRTRGEPPRPTLTTKPCTPGVRDVEFDRETAEADDGRGYTEGSADQDPGPEHVSSLSDN